MEKLKHSLSKYLPPVVLHLDDINEIIQILGDGDNTNVMLETENYRYSAKEIQKTDIEEPLKLMKYNKLEGIDITFRNDGYGVYLFLYSVSDLSYGKFKKIEVILKSKKRWIMSMICSLKYNFAFLLIGNISIFSLQYLGLLSWPKLFGIMCYIYGLYLFNALIAHGKLVSHNLIIYQRKKDRPNFFVRNRDHLMVGIIVGVVVSIISIVGTLYFTK